MTASARSTLVSLRTARVLVASTRAADGVYQDRTGPLIDEWLSRRGYAVQPRVIVRDGEEAAAALDAILGEQSLAAGLDDDSTGPRTRPDVVLTTGGTGLSPTDLTPEMTRGHLHRELPGVMEEIRRVGTESTPLAVLSRGLAGVTVHGTVIVNLPGSLGGVADGLGVLNGILQHVVDQLAGQDHVG